jgi:hypothetical protein
MSRLHCPGCGQERGMSMACPTCKKVYCGENCLRLHQKQHDFNTFGMAIAIFFVLLAVVVVFCLLMRPPI